MVGLGASGLTVNAAMEEGLPIKSIGWLEEEE